MVQLERRVSNHEAAPRAFTLRDAAQAPLLRMRNGLFRRLPLTRLAGLVGADFALGTGFDKTIQDLNDDATWLFGSGGRSRYAAHRRRNLLKGEDGHG